MNVNRSNFIEPLIICEPQTAGSTTRNKYYIYNVSKKYLDAINYEIVPKVRAIDEDGNTLYYPKQNGWLLKYKKLSGENKSCIIFSYSHQIYIDFGDEIICLLKNEYLVKIYRFLFFSCIRLNTKSGCKKLILHYFLWHKTWFLDDSREDNTCHAMTDIFTEIGTSQGYELWVERWESGLAVRNESIKIFEAP